MDSVYDCAINFLYLDYNGLLRNSTEVYDNNCNYYYTYDITIYRK